jgi:hypothetical protein
MRDPAFQLAQAAPGLGVAFGASPRVVRWLHAAPAAVVVARLAGPPVLRWLRHTLTAPRPVVVAHHNGQLA